MATFAELLADVYTLTNRSDLIAETKLAVKMATLKMHQRDYFYKDIRETGIQFLASDYTQQIDYRTLFPLYRSLKYIRKADSSGVPGVFFDILTPEMILDSYGVQQEDICYVAGAEIQVKSSTTFQYALIGIYQNPDIGETTYNSWVALDHPYAIVLEAAMVVLTSIGLKEDAAVYKTMRDEQVALLLEANLVAKGE